MNCGYISTLICQGVTANYKLIEGWKNELAILEKNNIDEEKLSKLKGNIEKAEDNLLLLRKTAKIIDNLDELEVF